MNRTLGFEDGWLACAGEVEKMLREEAQIYRENIDVDCATALLALADRIREENK
jgi:hypothetical protein